MSPFQLGLYLVFFFYRGELSENIGYYAFSIALIKHFTQMGLIIYLKISCSSVGHPGFASIIVASLRS